jgi:hypothetical protein
MHQLFFNIIHTQPKRLNSFEFSRFLLCYKRALRRGTKNFVKP